MTLPTDYNKLPPFERRAVRNKYVELQNNLCCECGESLHGPPGNFVKGKQINKTLFPKNFFDYPIHLHHDHETGLTIGAVHCECNAVLWQYYGE